VYLSVDPADGIVTAVRFDTRGCGPSPNSYSALAELVVGRSPREAQRLTQRELAQVIDGRAQQILYYSVLVHEALYAAAGDCLGERDRINPADDPITCRCFAVRESVIRRAVHMNRLTSVVEVTRCTNAAGSCGACSENVQAVVSRAHAELERHPSLEPRQLPHGEAAWRQRSEAELGAGAGTRQSAI
jgi:bacterioferritin-associated ferredoxin